MNFISMNICFILSISMFSFYYKHILLSLISLEFIMINLMWNFFTFLSMMNMNLFFISFYINLSICEGILGLSILTYMVRLTGNDYSNTMNMMKW